MKKILIILGDYYLGAEPNGNCIRKIVEYWTNNSLAEADIVCVEPSESLSNSYQHVYPVKKEFFSSNMLVENIFKFINQPLTNKKTIKKLETQVSSLLRTNDYDATIAVINPAETAQVVYDLSSKYNIRNKILYEIDPTSNRYKTPSGLLQKIWRFMSMRWEKKVYRVFDHVIHMESHRAHFSTNLYESFLQKTIFLDIPGLAPNVAKDQSKGVGLSCLYAGAFYPDIRRPDYMISLFKELEANSGIELNIYTNRMVSYIKDLIGEYQNIHLHDVIPEKELMKVQEMSDILISIGNKDSDFLPSKVLTYVSSGKCVIHFYDDDNDVALQYFKKYPKCIFIDQRLSIHENIKLILATINRITSIDVTNEFLETTFEANLVSYSANKILDLI